jgi:hypothetical protein
VRKASIAYFQIALPAEILVLAEPQLVPLGFNAELEDVGPVRIIVNRPYRSQLSTRNFSVGGVAPLFGDVDKLNPEEPPPVELVVRDLTARVVPPELFALGSGGNRTGSVAV